VVHRGGGGWVGGGGWAGVIVNLDDVRALLALARKAKGITTRLVIAGGYVSIDTGAGL
jgi:hypothetical protein